jgi:hypothetical protein
MPSKRQATGRQRMSDVVPTGNPWPEIEHTPIDSILGQDYFLTEIAWRKGSRGEFVYMQLTHPVTGERVVTRTGGKVVCDKLHQWEEKGSPDITVSLVMPGDYYDIL